MNPTKRKAFVLLMLMLLCLLLTSCYKEVDPWPASAPAATELTITSIPTQTPTAAPQPTAAPVQQVTLAPAVTVVPNTQPMQEDFWADEQPTEVPGGNMDPGFNG